MVEKNNAPNQVEQKSGSEIDENLDDFSTNKILEEGLKDLENRSTTRSREAAELIIGQVKSYEDLNIDEKELNQLEDRIKESAADTLRRELKPKIKSEKDSINELLEGGKINKKKRGEEMKKIDAKYNKIYEKDLASIVRSEKRNEVQELSDEKLKQAAKVALENLVVHGRIIKNKESGKFEVKNEGDLDVKAALYLLKTAGVDISKAEYVAPGEYREGKVNIDTGEMDGVAASYDEDTAFIDHHGYESSGNTSATRQVYEMLSDLGMLKDEKYKYLNRLTDFVDKVDNFKYPEKYFKNYFKDSWRSLFGLSKMLTEKHLEKFFKYSQEVKYLSPDDPMSDSILRKMGFIYKDNNGKEKGMALSHKDRVEKFLLSLQEAEKKGFIIDSGKKTNGKICINIDNNIFCDVEAVKAFGCDTYVAWSTKDNRFFISNLNGEELTIKLKNGKKIRKTMWINPDEENRIIGLGDILNKMVNKKGFKPSQELKNFLDKEIGEVKSLKIEDNLKNDSESVSGENEDNRELDPEFIKNNISLTDLEQDEIGGGMSEINLELDLRRENLNGKLKLLKDRFKNFVIANRGEFEFNRELLKRTHLIEDDFVKLRKIEKGTEEEAKILDDLEFQVNNLLGEDWEEELLRYKSENSSSDKENNFSPEEMEDINKLGNFVGEFIKNNLEGDPVWEKISKLGQVEFLKALILNTLEEGDIFFDKDEQQKNKIIETILNN